MQRQRRGGRATVVAVPRALAQDDAAAPASPARAEANFGFPEGPRVFQETRNRHSSPKEAPTREKIQVTIGQGQAGSPLKIP